MPRTHEDDVAQTYLGLRLAMVVLVGMLFLSVAVQIFSTDPICLQQSISAYYYTATRPVLVGVLCAIGACLIIYRGSTNVENVLLDFSGFLAVVVAFVPTQIDVSCKASNVPSPEELSAAVRNNVWVLLLVGMVGIVLAALTLRRRYAETGERLSTSAKVSLAVSLAALVAGGVFFAVSAEAFQRLGHNISASALFVGILAVVAVNALDAHRKGTAARAKTYRNLYAIVAISMVVVAGGIGLAGWLIEDFDNFLFWLEAALILGFAVFWVIQTVELGGAVARQPSASSSPAKAEVASDL